MEQLIVLAIFFVIWFIGWIGNLGKAKQQPPNKPGQPQRPAAGADDKLKAEIERFLQEVGVKPAEPPKPPAPTEQVVVMREVPTQSERRGPKKPRQQQKKKPDTSKNKPRPQLTSGSGTASVFGDRVDDLANKHLAKSTVGEAFREQHLKTLTTPMTEYLARREKGQSHEDAASSLRAQLSPEEIQRAARIFQEKRQGGSVARGNEALLAMFKNPQTVKQAIIISEILKRPKLSKSS